MEPVIKSWFLLQSLMTYGCFGDISRLWKTCMRDGILQHLCALLSWLAFVRSELSSILSRSFFCCCYKSYFYSFYKTLGFYLDLYNKVVALFEYYFCLLFADAASLLSVVIFYLRDSFVWVCGCVCVCGIVFIDKVLLFCLPKTSSKWAIIFAIVLSDRVVDFRFLSWDLIFKWALVVILQVPAVRLNTNC